MTGTKISWAGFGGHVFTGIASSPDMNQNLHTITVATFDGSLLRLSMEDSHAPLSCLSVSRPYHEPYEEE